MEQLSLAVGDSAGLRRQKAVVKAFVQGYLKDYDYETDALVVPEMLKLFLERVEARFIPDQVVANRQNLENRAYVQSLYRKSLFSDSLKIKDMIANFDARTVKMLQKDKLYMLYTTLSAFYKKNTEPAWQKLNQSILQTQKAYMAAILEMKKGQRIMADANLTLRVTYGKIEGYEPKDGVYYQAFTTLQGVMEKADPNISDYVVPEKLKRLYRQKDYGAYTDATGEVPIAFCASNHTTGGNSGSPVLNQNGELIGVNFDRCWEGTMSDVLFDPDRCRNIALDIRYALFIIDKFAGAGYLLEEMKLVH
jgi:hypothetical protein